MGEPQLGYIIGLYPVKHILYADGKEYIVWTNTRENKSDNESRYLVCTGDYMIEKYNNSGVESNSLFYLNYVIRGQSINSDYYITGLQNVKRMLAEGNFVICIANKVSWGGRRQ